MIRLLPISLVEFDVINIANWKSTTEYSLQVTSTRRAMIDQCEERT